jgi:peptide/nickel transport system permease protein
MTDVISRGDGWSQPATTWTRAPGARWLWAVARRAVQLVVVLFVISTVLFFLLRLSGDPAVVLAGEFADPEFVTQVRQRYGLDRSLIVQYGSFMAHAAQLDFGTSVQAGSDALERVIDRSPSTIQLAGLAVLVNTLVAVPLGAWIGARPNGKPQTVASAGLFVGQGVPGYVTGLLLIQVFSVELGWLPSIGNRGRLPWLLPVLTLAAFQVPRLTRVVASNVTEAMNEDYVRTARANGAAPTELIVRHALPNAVLGATALIGGQFAFLLSGALITEVIFAWPGLGGLLVESVRELDFPVVQAGVFVVAVLVFTVNLIVDFVLGVIDPRIRRRP